MNDTAERLSELERERVVLNRRLGEIEKQIEDAQPPQPEWWPDWMNTDQAKAGTMCSSWSGYSRKYKQHLTDFVSRLRTRYSAPRRELDEQWVERAAERIVEDLALRSALKGCIASILRDSLVETEKGGGDV
jgi:hypothetical protein